MSDHEAVPSESELVMSEPVVRPSKPLVPPTRVWIVAGVAVLLIICVRLSEFSVDHALVNILTLVLSFVAFCSFAFWFLFGSGYHRAVRFVSLLALVSCIVLFFRLYEVEHVSGELIPVFRLRSSPPRDALLTKSIDSDAAATIDLSTTTERDFPEFLGPRRDGILAEPKLITDWEQHPPRQIWRQPIGAGWSGFVAVNGYAFTLEQRGDEELVTCYEIATGKLLWVHGELARHSTVLGGVGPRSTPTIHDGLVHTLGATGILLCLDGSSGKVIWRDNLLERYKVPFDQDGLAIAWGRSNSPLIVDDLLVVPVGGPLAGPHVSLAAFQRRTGELVWEAGDRQVSFASPALETLLGIRQIVSVNQDNVTGHEPETGRQLWQIAWPGNSSGNVNASQARVLGDNRLLLSKAYGGGAAVWELSAESDGSVRTTEVWANHAVLKTKFTNVVTHEGFAYALSDGILECVDLLNGERKWRRGRYGHGQILLVGNVLLVQAESGEIVLVEANSTKLQELGRLDAITGKTWNNPCLFGDLLLVRNAEEAACYRLPVEE